MKTMRRFIGATNGSVPTRQRLTLRLIAGMLVLLVMVALLGTGDAEAAPEPCDEPSTIDHVITHHHPDCEAPKPTNVDVYEVECGTRTFLYSFCMP